MSYAAQAADARNQFLWNLLRRKFSSCPIFSWVMLFQLHDVNCVVAVDSIHVDVSEESEYDLWSDRFGSWIGRSSKSRSPDSLKNSRYDRKSSSGYSFISCASVYCCYGLTWFINLFFARSLHPTTPHTSLSMFLFWFCYCVTEKLFVARLGGVSSSASPDFYEATGRRSSSGNEQIR